jgi:hypothetical protein
MPATSSGEQDDILQKLEALTSANVCTDPTRVLREAKKLIALLQHAPLNREHFVWRQLFEIMLSRLLTPRNMAMP